MKIQECRLQLILIFANMRSVKGLRYLRDIAPVITNHSDVSFITSTHDDVPTTLNSQFESYDGKNETAGIIPRILYTITDARYQPDSLNNVTVEKSSIISFLKASKTLTSSSWISVTSRMTNGYGIWHPFANTLLEAIEEEVSLARLLAKVIFQYLRGCDLIIIIDRSFEESQVFKALLGYPNVRQVVILPQRPKEIVDRVSWRSSRCQGTLILISDPEPFEEFGNQVDFAWDYSAKVLIAGLTRYHLEKFISTTKGRKTKHIIGIVKSHESGIFKILMNELFWGSKRWRQISTWRQDSFTQPTELFPEKTIDLRNVTLNVVVFELEPFIMYLRNSKGTITMRYGRDVEVARTLAHAFNFTAQFISPPPNELFGEQLPNGTVTGMDGLLYTGKGDLALSDIWHTRKRSTFMDCSVPYSTDQGCFLARIDPPLPLWQSPGLPYQMITWITIFVGMVLSGPLLFLFALGGGNGKTFSKKIGQQSLVTSSLYAYGVHFSQPVSVLPRRSSTRIFIAFLWIYSVILITGYKSNLTAFLTKIRESKSIETFKELADSHLRVKGFKSLKFRIESSDFEHQRMLAKKYDVALTFDEVKRDILDGMAVQVHSKVIIDFTIRRTSSSTGKPSFRIMKECLPQYSVIVAYQKHSPLKPKFDQIIAMMFEGGLPRKWFLDSIRIYRKHNKETSLTSDNQHESGVIPLALEHLQGVFIVWFLAMFAGTLNFFGEIVVVKR